MYNISKMPIVFIISRATNHPLLSFFDAFHNARPFQNKDHAKTIAKSNGGISLKEERLLNKGFMIYFTEVCLNMFVLSYKNNLDISLLIMII